MAGEDLYTALSGLNVAPVETPYGMGAVTLARSLPQLVNPYGSVGTNLGVVLGGTLLSSLLGYQANRQATEQSLQLGRLGSQLQTMQTPEQRLSFIEGVDSSLMQRRLLGLQNALQARETAIQYGAEEAQKRQEAQYAALGSEAGKSYIAAQADLYNQKRDIDFENKMELESFRKESALDLAKLKGTQRLELEAAVQEGRLTRDQAKARIQDVLNEAQSRRRLGEKQFEASLDTDAADVPLEVRREVKNATSISTQIFDLANRVDKMNLAEFKIYKTWDALPRSFKAEFSDIKSIVGNARYGASLTGNELATLEAIFGNDYSTDPEAFARNLRNAATNLLQKAKIGVQVSQVKPANLNRMLDQMITRQTGFEDLDIVETPKQVQMPAPVKANIDGVFNDLSEAPVSNIATPIPAAAPTTAADSVEVFQQDQAALLQEAERYDQKNGPGSARKSPTFQQRAAQLKERKAKLGI